MNYLESLVCRAQRGDLDTELLAQIVVLLEELAANIRTGEENE